MLLSILLSISSPSLWHGWMFIRTYDNMNLIHDMCLVETALIKLLLNLPGADDFKLQKDNW